MQGNRGNRVFISYRRDDTGGIADELAASLRKRLEPDLGSDVVFLDTTSIASGEKYRQPILDAVTGCDVFVALVGKAWTPARLREPGDFVHFEIMTALCRNGLAIIPVTVDTELPRKEELPPSVVGLLDWNAAQISLNERRERDVQELVSIIEQLLRRRRRYRSDDRERAPVNRNIGRRRWILGVAAVVFLLTAAGIGKRSIVGACGRDIVIVKGGSVDQRRTVNSYFVNAAGAEGLNEAQTYVSGDE